jgi:uncharacterized protein YukE
VLSILQRTNNSRNRWTGHGGAVSDTEAEKRHSELLQEIQNLREILGSVARRIKDNNSGFELLDIP